jgi:thiol-disulfide isomerase/thioredoxin
MWSAFLPLALAASGPDSEHWLAGATAPEVAVSTLGGESAAVPWAGQDAVVVLWAGWCGPCVSELPVLAVAMERAGKAGRPVTLVAIDDEPKVARRALNRVVRDAPAWTSVWGGPKAAGLFGARTLPTAYVLRADGRVESVWTGHQDLSAWATILGVQAP